MHDKTKPLMYWNQEGKEGKILFVVFYTQKCKWAKCVGCNLHHISSEEHVTFRDIIAQIDYVIEQEDFSKIDKLIISNNGSMLDEDTFSTTALMYLVLKLNLDYPNVKYITMETRPEYVDIEELEILKRALLEGNDETELELAIGFEAFNNTIRNDKFKKGLSLETFGKMVEMVSKYNYSLKCYFMLKPVAGISTEEAITDIHDAVTYLNAMSMAFDVKINMHLNPTYVAKNTELEKQFNAGEFTPPTLVDVARAVYYAKDIENDKFSIYVGLNDEGLAVEGGSFIRENDAWNISQLEHFNRTQDFDAIDSIIFFDELNNK